MPIAAKIPENEEKRIKALNSYCVLDTPPEQGFDRLTSLAATIFKAPIALVSLVDRDRQWFKSRVGLGATETHRDLAFCAHAILNSTVFYIHDATKDPRFCDSPLVVGPPNIRTYLGAPLITPEGLHLVSLCVIFDEVTDIPEEKFVMLEQLAAVVIDELELRYAYEDARQAREEANLANEAKSTFLANMSHEIRTPMNGITVMLETLVNSSLDEKQFMMARTALQSSRELVDIINDILDISKLEEGKIELNPTAFSPQELVTNLTNLFSEVASQKGLRLLIEGLDRLPEYLTGDAMRIRQVITNLLNNAIKFTDQGDVTLNIETTDKTVKFSVIDNGIGISKENAERLFQRFIQADITISRRYGGSGLGLSICKQLIDLMDGNIGVNSVEGEGSTFWFQIPKITPQKSDLENQNDNVHNLIIDQFEQNNAQLNILAADDNAINRQVLKMVMEDLNQQVTLVENGQQALDKLNEESFDVVLMDIQMPVMTGIEATEAIRNSGQPYKDIPIIAITANAIKGVEEEYLMAGMDGYIQKPYKPQKILHDILTIIRNKT